MFILLSYLKTIKYSKTSIIRLWFALFESNDVLQSPVGLADKFFYTIIFVMGAAMNQSLINHLIE